MRIIYFIYNKVALCGPVEQTASAVAAFARYSLMRAAVSSNLIQENERGHPSEETSNDSSGNKTTLCD